MLNIKSCPLHAWAQDGKKSAGVLKSQLDNNASIFLSTFKTHSFRWNLVLVVLIVTSLLSFMFYTRKEHFSSREKKKKKPYLDISSTKKKQD